MPDITRNLAIIVGIDKYSHVPKLTSAGNDARKLTEILENPKTYGYDVLKLLDEQASCQQFSNLIEDLRHGKIQLENELITLEKNHRLLFYFAGHGIADDAPENEERPEGFLVPQDAELNTENSKLISMQLLHDALVNTPCRHLLIILDCCFAGSFRWAGLYRNAVRFESTKVYLERYRRFIEKRAQQVITSAAHNQKAFDSIYRFGKRADIGGHSPFAELLFKALTTQADRSLNRSNDKYLTAIAEDGVVTATELYTYLHGKLHESLGAVSERQTPGFCQLRGHEEGEYIFPLPGFKESLLATAEKLSEKLNPYKGLDSFEVGDSELFFGRKTLTDALCKVVDTQSLTVVLGASGSGKSSLVKAGLIPCLTMQGENLTIPRAKWQILMPIRPGEAPLSSLNAALAQSHLPTVSLPGQSGEYEQRRLADSISAWSKDYPDTKLLLVIDQFEELITLCRNDEWRDQFLDSIAEALVTQPQLRVVLTLRSDFEPQLRDHRTLKERWQEARFIVRAMTREELRQAIEEPAAARVMFFEPPDLVEQLIDEVANMPGALPLLSFALSELYLISLKGGQGDRTITEEDYRTLGGVTRSITQRAEQVYQELVAKDKSYEQTIRNVMLRMISTGGGELARKRIPLSELEYPEPEKSRVDKVKESFIAARLLVPGQYTEEEQLAMDDQIHLEHPDVEEQTIEQEFIEPAHDALVRGWSRLREWRRNYEERIALQQSLTPVAVEWKKSGQSVGYLWTRDPRLALLEKIVDPQTVDPGSGLIDSIDSPEDENWLNSLEEHFVRNSVQERTNQLKETERQRNEAIEGQITALSSLSQAQMLTNDQLGGLLSSVKAAVLLNQTPWLKQKLESQVFESLQQAIYAGQERNRLEGNSDPIYYVSFSQDGQFIVTAGWDKTVRLWSINGELIRVFESHNDEVYCAQFSSDQRMIASSSRDKTVKLWNVEDGTLLQTFHGHTDRVWSVSFRPGDRILASASEDGTVKLWNVQDGTLIKNIQSHNGAVLSVCFNPDGTLLASGGWDQPPWQGYIKLWSPDGEPIKVLPLEHNGLIRCLYFSCDSKLLVSTSDDRTVKLWRISDGSLVTDIEAHQEGLWAMGASLSSDGEMIASVGTDKEVKLWSIEGNLLKVLPGHGDAVYAVAISPDGRMVASASADRTVKLWNADLPFLKSLQEQDSGPSREVAFSPDGKWLASANLEYDYWNDEKEEWVVKWVIKLWDLEGRLIHTLLEHKQDIRCLSFSHDSQMLASASWDGTIKLWHTDGQLLKTLTEHQQSVESICFSPDGKNFVSSGYGGKIKLWTVDGTLIRDIPSELDGTTSKENTIFMVSFSPDGRLLAAAGADRLIKLWKTDDYTPLNALAGHSNWVISLSFDQKGEVLASASTDRTIKLWKTIDGTLIRTIDGHSDAVNEICFIPNSELLVSASSDKTLKAWSKDGSLLKTFIGHRNAVYGISVSPDGKTIASASWDGTIKTWNAEILGFEELLEQGRYRLQDYLNTNPNALEDRKLINNIDDQKQFNQ